MKDQYDQATLELPGLDTIQPNHQENGRRNNGTNRKAMRPQQQLSLLEVFGPTDTTGLPAWVNDDNLDLSGLPKWR